MNERHSLALPIHHFTGLQAVGIVNGRLVWPIRGGSEPGGGDGQAAGTDTATADKPFEAITSQDALNILIADRVRRAESKGFKSAEDKYKPGHERAEALDLELSSETEKAVKTARDEERAKAQAETTPRIVRAEFRAAAKGVLGDDQLTALLEDLDLSRYVDSKGDVDEDKVAKKIAAFAPVKGTQQHRPLGQGNQPPANTPPGERGRLEAEKRYGKRS